MNEYLEDTWDDTRPIPLDEPPPILREYETGAVNGAPITTGKASGEIEMVSDKYVKTQTRFGWAIVWTIFRFILLWGVIGGAVLALLFRVACS